MADFHTHIQTSCGLGAAYALGGALMGLPTDACLLAGGLCGLGGMLPDLDSDTGIPFRETTAFLAAISPMLMIDRWVSMGFSVEGIVLAGAGVYLAIGFGLFRLLQLYTVHRGMFHSLPAMAIVGQVAFLLCTCHSLDARYYKAAGVMLGYLSHLVLDEVYSVDFYNLRIKKSFGTALKLLGDQWWPNLFSYGMLFILGGLMYQDPLLQRQWHLWQRVRNLPQLARNEMLAPHLSYSRNLYAPKYYELEAASGPLTPIDVPQTVNRPTDADSNSGNFNGSPGFGSRPQPWANENRSDQAPYPWVDPGFQPPSHAAQPPGFDDGSVISHGNIPWGDPSYSPAANGRYSRVPSLIGADPQANVSPRAFPGTPSAPSGAGWGEHGSASRLEPLPR